MISRQMGRIVALATLMGSAMAAQAFQIDIESHGNYALGAGNYTVTESVIFQQTSIAKPGLTTMSYTVNTAVGPPFLGSGFYSNGVDSFKFDMSLTGDVPTDGFSVTQAAHGFWTYTGGAGAFAGLHGSGVISSNYDAPMGNTSLTVLSGRLEAVPEPATLAVIGLGLVGVIRRRRK